MSDDEKVFCKWDYRGGHPTRRIVLRKLSYEVQTAGERGIWTPVEAAGEKPGSVVAEFIRGLEYVAKTFREDKK